MLGLVGVFGAGYAADPPGVRRPPRRRRATGCGWSAAPASTAAAWTDVEDAATAHAARACPCVVLQLRDGRTTTIPVAALAADREEFVRDLQAHLQRGHGLRPL